MKISTVIIGIALFAIVTMILYGWGIVKQKNQTSDLMNLLFSKGQDKIKKYLKQHEYVTISQVEQICEGLEAKQPFSRLCEETCRIYAENESARTRGQSLQNAQKIRRT